jgi:hypothetical protein
MRISKPLPIVIGLIVVIAGPIIFRPWWVSHPPSRPKNMPASAVWIAGPPAPLFLAPRGVWLGCWLEAQRGVDKCRFANYDGVVLKEGDYTTCNDNPPVPETRLKPRNHDQSTAFIFLQDGTMLWVASECEIRKHSGNVEWCPQCKEPWPRLKQQNWVTRKLFRTSGTIRQRW